MRRVEASVANHSDRVFQKHYKQDAAKDSYIAHDAFQERRDTVKPIKDLGENDVEDVIEEDRAKYKKLKSAKPQERKKNKLATESKVPISSYRVRNIISKLSSVRAWVDLPTFKAWKQAALRYTYCILLINSLLHF